MAEIATFTISEEALLDGAEMRIDSGDLLGALSMLNRREALYPPSADAYALYADIYELLELYPLAADAWFRFLDVCNEADFPEAYEGLAVCFMNMEDHLQAAIYYHRTIESSLEEGEDVEEEVQRAIPQPQPQPPLRIVGTGRPEVIRAGLDLLKEGQLAEARETFLTVEGDEPDYPTAAGLAAMCALMSGDEESAQRECEELLQRYPDNVQALTTYCAVLGAREKKEEAKLVAKQLASLPAEATDDLYRIATALCETGLDEDAARVLSVLKERLPYDSNVLWFHAVACFRIGRCEEAVSSLEQLVTVYPRKAVAQLCLERLRAHLDGSRRKFTMNYFYRMPAGEYRAIAQFMLGVLAFDKEDCDDSVRERVREAFRLAFDEMEGKDAKLQMLAVKVADHVRADDVLRAALLTADADDVIKLEILHLVTCRNEDASFGTVFLNLYREFFTHEIEIGDDGRAEFLAAFADVYSKYALLGEENEGKLCGAAEDVYAAIETAGMDQYYTERNALAAVIYREARMEGAERSFEKIVGMFDADRLTAQAILDLLM